MARLLRLIHGMLFETDILADDVTNNARMTKLACGPV